MSTGEGVGVGFTGGGGREKGKGVRRVGGRVGTGKGTGKSMRVHLSKLPFSKLPLSSSPTFLPGNFACIAVTGMTGRPGDRTIERIGGSTLSYLARTPRVPLLMLVLIGLEAVSSKGAFRLPGATWDHFRCTVDPSPGHIWCGVLLLPICLPSNVPGL